MEKCSKDLFWSDPNLVPFARQIRSRTAHARSLAKALAAGSGGSLYRFADYHLRFGLFRTDQGWQFREWAPNARKIFIISGRTGWAPDPAFALERKKGGIFQGKFPTSAFSHGDLFRLRVCWPGGEGDRIPTAARRVVQDPFTLIFNAQVWTPSPSFAWHHPVPRDPDPSLLIYEAHVGMALEQGRVGTFAEFKRHILPKIRDAGYTAIQLMAIQEHPYYGSLGYHVSSFFAPSSRFGTPEELKQLIDEAHGMGMAVFMDMVHSHAVRNEVEGLSRFDGTLHQFFHKGERGFHHLWDSRCFDYQKVEVLCFLLSNLRYWLEEFRVDGFRFDGITSMLFEDHGIDRAFTRYEDYFGPGSPGSPSSSNSPGSPSSSNSPGSPGVDPDALAYLWLANTLVHNIRPKALTIAEDVSGYPGLAAPLNCGGTGFDFRFAMGIADHWIRLVKDVRDEAWHLGTLWYELTCRRPEERTISYAECHDQALVGDQTLMMRLMGAHIYTAMGKNHPPVITTRAVALHKMIRLITLACAHSGYLNFMGNEFGHPDWVDFPSRQNRFSFDHARRQWSLKYDKALYYSDLFEFDRQMTALARTRSIFSSPDIRLLALHEQDKVLAFERGKMVFAFNFHAHASYTGYQVDGPPGKYAMILDTDEERFGGQARLTPGQVHFTQPDATNRPDGNNGRHWLSLYLPSRCALVLEKI